MVIVTRGKHQCYHQRLSQCLFRHALSLIEDFTGIRYEVTKAVVVYRSHLEDDTVELGVVSLALSH